MHWTVEQTKTQDVDLRIIQGHYPWAVKTQLGEHIALVKSQTKAKTGFAKASQVNERDKGFENAELISAAPEMFEALSDCLAMLVNGEDGCDDTLERVIDSTRKALRKAKPD